MGSAPARTKNEAIFEKPFITSVAGNTSGILEVTFGADTESRTSGNDGELLDGIFVNKDFTGHQGEGITGNTRSSFTEEDGSFTDEELDLTILVELRLLGLVINDMGVADAAVATRRDHDARLGSEENLFVILASEDGGTDNAASDVGVVVENVDVEVLFDTIDFSHCFFRIFC